MYTLVDIYLLQDSVTLLWDTRQLKPASKLSGEQIRK